MNRVNNIDVVIPLSSGSIYDNLELRMALRSIEKHLLRLGKIYIIADHAPAFLKQVDIINVPDTHKHNKDANIIDKLLAAAQLKKLSDDFIFWSDDQLLLMDLDAGFMQPVFNRRGSDCFCGDRIWHRRMRRTFDFLKQNGKYINWNWDSHVPQKMNKYCLQKIFNAIDYASDIGYCVNTIYFGMLDTPPRLQQNALKQTVEQSVLLPDLANNKVFLGYNDAALKGNLLTLLQRRFPHPCGFEQSS